MTRDPNEVMERAADVLDRMTQNRIAHGGRGGRSGSRGAAGVKAKLATIAVADSAILVLAVVIGLLMPIGLFGALAVMALLVAVTLVIALAPTRAPSIPEPAKLRAVDLKVLPAQTERWLTAQRPALPAPAAALVDRIGVQLEGLSPQLAGLGDDTQAAGDVRKLVGEQLPAFVSDYSRVPVSLRGVPRNGRTPDADLVEGLKLIEREIADMTAQLAQGDLDSFATRGRFLEMKYRDEA